MGRRRKRFQPFELTVSIESLADDTRGVARHEGKTVFVSGALPGETVRCLVRKKRSKFDEADLIEVIDASPDRVNPRCSAAGVCGGCSLQHMSGEAQVRAKQQVLLDSLAHIGKIAPEKVLPPLEGPHWNYRRKARLGVRVVPKKGGVLVGFREARSSYIAVLERCDILDKRFADLIAPLQELISMLSIAKRIPQIEVAAGDDTAMLVFRHLEPLTDEDLTRLRDFGQAYAVNIMLQPKGPDSVQPLNPECDDLLSYRLEDWNLEVQFRPTDFTQVNAGINRLMIRQALELLEPGKDDRVLDLFCGLGNFTLPLARTCGHVTGIEGDPALVSMARDNAARNGLANTEFITSNLYEEPLEGNWLQQKWDQILLDPPRSGAREVIARLPELHPRRIVYVSCNPATLARDAGILVNEFGYTLTAAGIMDMFPHTAHVESIAVFDAPVK